MAFKCDRCGKGRVITSQQRHKKGVAGGRWKYRAPKSKKILKPNLQTYRGVLDGKMGKWRLCTKCLKLVKKKQKAKQELTTKSAIVEKVAKPAKQKSPTPKSA